MKKNVQKKLVKDCMTRNPEYITPNTTLREAAAEMLRLDTGSLPVGHDNDHIIGFITDRDIAIRAVARGLDVNSTRVSQIMSTNVLSCSQNDDLETVAKQMKQNLVLRLVVLDDRKNLVGVISHGDLSNGIMDKSDELCMKVADLASFNHKSAQIAA